MHFHKENIYDLVVGQNPCPRRDLIWSKEMANERSPRSATAANRTTRSKKTSDPEVPVTETPVSTAQVTEMTARNNVQTSKDTPDTDEIRRRAYQLYEERGRQDGSHEEDWHRAETELLGSPRKQDRGQNRNQGRSQKSA